MRTVKMSANGGLGGVVFALAISWLGVVQVRAQEPAIVLTAHSSLQTFRAGESPRDALAAIRLSAALGEAESFQLALLNRSTQELNPIRIAISGLDGVRATIYAAAATQVAKPGRSGGMPAGRYFDLLRPAGAESVAAGQYQPYWIDLQVDETAPCGLQNGLVQVTTPQGTQVLPVQLLVRGFRLPAVPTLKVAFACGLNWMEAYSGKPLTRQQIRAVHSMMLEHRLGPLPMWGSGAELFGDGPWLKHCLDHGMNVVLLACGGTTEEQIEKSLAALEPKVSLLESLGALDRTYLFGYDEIAVTAPDRIPAMREAFERFHRRHPAIRRINTSQPDARLEPFVDIFVVPTARFAPPMAEGRETWWYSVGDDNLAQEPDFRIDFPPVVHRGFFLADWKAGVKGHLYWAVQREWPANQDLRENSRPENQWRHGYVNVSSHSWTESNGGGNLFYPDGAGGMLPTPRVKRIRDGIEDFEYLAQLRDAASQLEQSKPSGWQRLAEEARELLLVPDPLVHLGKGWREGWSVAESQEAACSATSHPAAIHGGQRALRVLPDPAGVTVTQDVAVRPGEPGVFAAWIKTNDLSGQACLAAEFIDSQGKTISCLRSEPATGSTGSFVRRELGLPAAPPAATTLRLGLTATAGTPSDSPESPLQKAFFDDLELCIGQTGVPLCNPGFEAEALRIGDDSSQLLSYRERVGECLEHCLRAGHKNLESKTKQ